MKMLKVGDKAPPFTLPDGNENQISLNDLFIRSKIVSGMIL